MYVCIIELIPDSMKTNNTETTEGTEFLSVIMANYRVILIFITCSCLAAAIITFFTPKEYISSAVIFPTESNSLDDVIRNPQFGYDVEADRLIQLLDSRMIRDSIIRKFNLIKYYDIDKSDNDWDYQLTQKFHKDITFTKTVFMSVIISARSRFPEMSAEIVNEIVSRIGKVREKLLKSNVYFALSSMQKEYNSLKSDLDSLSGVLDRLTRNRSDIKQYVQTEKYVSLIFDKKQMANDEAGKALQLVVNQYNIKLSWFYDVQNRLKNAVLMSQRPLPSVYIIDSGKPSYKKVYPKYSVNLLIAFIASSIFISFFFFFIQKFRNFKSNFKTE
jgi:capsular polysaccharide biosynthesis protein